MPNWCSTAYAIEGDAKEVKSLYDLMNELQKQKEPSVPNGFGTAWLGCLVDALEGNWENVFCRGSWYNLEFDGRVLTFNTETAWSPCNEMFDMVCEKYTTLNYFYRFEDKWKAHGSTYRISQIPFTQYQWLFIVHIGCYTAKRNKQFVEITATCSRSTCKQFHKYQVHLYGVDHACGKYLGLYMQRVPKSKTDIKKFR